MKIASVLMSLVFAGIVAQANETAPAAHTATPAPATAEVKKEEVKAEKKAAKKKHAKAATETAPVAPATPAGH